MPLEEQILLVRHGLFVLNSRGDAALNLNGDGSSSS